MKRQDISSVKYLFSVHQESPFSCTVNWVPGGTRTRWEIQAHNLGIHEDEGQEAAITKSYLKLIFLSGTQTMLFRYQQHGTLTRYVC